jgi:hypothetical protein
MNQCAPCCLASRSQQSGALACASLLSLRGLRGSRRNSGRGSRHARRSAALNALHPSTPALVRSACGSGTRYKLAFKPGSHNTSIERTPYGTLRVPPVAAHVERYAAANPTFAGAGLSGARKGVQRGVSHFGVAR